MRITDKYSEITKEEFKNFCINADGSATYRVQGVELDDLIGSQDDLNNFLVDQCVENGTWLLGVHYKFIEVNPLDGTVTIEVHIDDTSEWTKENDRQFLTTEY